MAVVMFAAAMAACTNDGPLPAQSVSPSASSTPTTNQSATPSATTSTAAGAIVIAAAGDIACDPGRGAFNNLEGTAKECRMKATADVLHTLRASRLDAVLTLGDNQYEDGARAKYDASYDKTWGAFKDITRPAPGNHDYRSAAGYYGYFGQAAGDPSKGYYSWDLGGWHFIVLNSNCSQAGGCDRGSPQEVWLRRDLEERPAACTLAYWHHSRFSSGRHGSSDTYADLWQALDDYHADVVLTGHDHTYERFAPMSPAGTADPHGIRSFVVGTGGRSHYGFEKIERGSEVRDNTAFGVLKMTLRSGSYDWAFVPAAPATFTDTGSGTCH